MNTATDKQRFWWWQVMLYSALAIAVYALVAYLVLPLGAVVHPEMQVTYQAHPVGIYTHVLVSVVALIIGPFQFRTGPDRQRTPLHRIMGRVYLLAVGVGGLSGLYMSAFAFGGWISTLGFALLGLAWLGSGGMALWHIRAGHVGQHRQWMMRNYALTLAAVTLRIYMGLYFGLGIALTGVDSTVAFFPSFYPSVAWMCWIPNLIVVERLIRAQPHLAYT